MTLDKQIIFMEELLSDDDHWSSKKAKSEYKQLLKWLKDYKRLLEMPKGDLISREALKEEVNKKKVVGRFNTLLLIDNAPTVAVNCKDCDGYEAGYSAGMRDTERPQGEWIRKVDEVGFISHICSECGAEIEVEDPKDDKFCFSCGADMRKGGAE